ncbi:MAG: hypothetical protein AAF492_02030 [Verrucomicrobiota bacterium]
MKPRIKLAEATTPDGSSMTLHEHDGDFSISVDGTGLMGSRTHESELVLARLGCAHLTEALSPRILIGGLGMGYTLRETLEQTSPKARIDVLELMPEIVAWNEQFLDPVPLKDKRVRVTVGDVVKALERSKETYDTILLDIDNGPEAITDVDNHRLYGEAGIRTCRRALRNKGALAIWSVQPNKAYERRLMRCGFKVNRYRAPAYPGSKSLSRFIWVASEDRNKLPPGGGEPRTPKKRKTRGKRR